MYRLLISTLISILLCVKGKPDVFGTSVDSLLHPNSDKTKQILWKRHTLTICTAVWSKRQNWPDNWWSPVRRGTEVLLKPHVATRRSAVYGTWSYLSFYEFLDRREKQTWETDVSNELHEFSVFLCSPSAFFGYLGPEKQPSERWKKQQSCYLNHFHMFSHTQREMDRSAPQGPPGAGRSCG